MENWMLALMSILGGLKVFALIFYYPRIWQFLKTLWNTLKTWDILRKVWNALKILEIIALKKKKKRLQADIGEKPTVEIGEFVNWANTRSIQNLLIVKPTCLTEVQAVVKAAVKNKLRVRCAGKKHSWSPMFPDEGNILMYNLDIQRHDGPRIELIKNKDGSNKVNVMSGVTIEELMDFELKNKINLPCNVVSIAPTYGGIVAMGCHGVGWSCQAISDYCTQMRIVDASGELRTFRKEDDLDMMLAVQCNLGMFGIIYDMQLLVWEEVIAHVQDNFNYNADLFYNAEKLKEIVTTNDSVEIFHFPFNSVGWSELVEEMKSLTGEKETLTRKEWDPKNDQLHIRQIKFNTPEEAKGKKLEPDTYYKTLDVQTWYAGKAAEVIDFLLLNYAKQLIPTVCKASHYYLRKTSEGTRWQPLPSAIHFKPANIHHMNVTDMEVCINVQDDFSNVTQVCQTILELVRQEGEKGRFPLNIVLKMRWMKYSEAYLCPAIVGSPSEGGSGHTFYIEIHSFAGTSLWQEFANKVALELLKIKGVQFNWAKEWDYVDGVVEYIQKTNAVRIKKFKTALARSGCDPDGVFLNKKLQEIFFPEQ